MKPTRADVAVLGHFPSRGLKTGQTIRTELLVSEVAKRIGKDRVIQADTAWLGRKPLRTVVALRQAFMTARDVIIMPGPRGLSILLPLYLRWQTRLRNRIHYVVVGGWLPMLLHERPRLVKRLSKCQGLYVQSERMARELHGLGLEKTSVLPNFREFPLDRTVSANVGAPLRLVFFSRIIPEKGVELAIESVNALNKGQCSPVATLDIWGPLTPAERPWFNEVMKRAGPAVRYCDFLEPHMAHEKLCDYDALVFPTYYFGEGFPGVVIDAFVAGLAVVASDWQDNREFVKHEGNGLVFRDRDVVDLSRQLRRLIDCPHELSQFKANAAASAAAYHVDVVIPPLLRQMGIALP
jgi:glycosyltransferase involved in cell wall biosynthesis